MTVSGPLLFVPWMDAKVVRRDPQRPPIIDPTRESREDITS
ncbi:hypothetical protein CCHR01_05470 [Colletotrichum chrysophilum]|uniref:Uncharacterized protein n=1 Tax=Colletotrichum chrysophilum TaxID=1836956 RepID=A0AAD9ASE2_9PEZI|nr:hypothetical protein CCHR01_05470 [Colletotrichum chrysophilum]